MTNAVSLMAWITSCWRRRRNKKDKNKRSNVKKKNEEEDNRKNRKKPWYHTTNTRKQAYLIHNIEAARKTLLLLLHCTAKLSSCVCVHVFTLNRMSVHMALPWVMMGSWSSPFPSQQSSSTHLTSWKAHRIQLYLSYINMLFSLEVCLHWRSGVNVFLHLEIHYLTDPWHTFTCIQTAAPGGTSLLKTSLQTVALSGKCCGRSWWSSGPATGPSPGTAPAGPRKLERFRLTSGTGRSHHWTCDLEEKIQGSSR